MKIKLLRRVLALTASSCVMASAAQAQVFPSRIVTMVVPYPAGGQSDHVARTIQPELTKQLGHQVIVDNVSGVGGALGIQKALQAAADGHTLVLALPSDLILAPLTMRRCRPGRTRDRTEEIARGFESSITPSDRDCPCLHDGTGR